MRSGLVKILKAAAAVLVGLALLDVFCGWYYNPAGYIQDEAWATDVVREPGMFTSRANEGFSWRNIDANGYVNDELPGEDGIFVLMMGSSHVEGLYVQSGKDVSSQLAKKLRESGVDGFVYNIGISSHDLTRNVHNLDRALTRFAPTGYVLLETRTVMHYYDQVYGVLNGTMGRMSETEVVGTEWLSRRPLLRTVYRQLMNLRTAEAATDGRGEGSLTETITQEILDMYAEAMPQLMQVVRDTADAHGVTPIIYYHPELLLQEDGSAEPDTYLPCLEIYKEACEQAGVCFLDLTDVFLEAYEAEHILTNGFWNTKPGMGHLNDDGNRIVAQVLCAEILEREAAK